VSGILTNRWWASHEDSMLVYAPISYPENTPILAMGITKKHTRIGRWNTSVATLTSIVEFFINMEIRDGKKSVT
jgi:hypothetical protein